MRKSAVFSLISLIVLLLGASSNSAAVLIDLSSWDVHGPITFSSDGLSATLSEDENGPGSLENLNFLVPDDAVDLSFNYSLTIAPDNDDYFDFNFNDPSAPIFEVGELNTTADAKVFSGSYSLSQEDDVSLAEYRGTFVPIIFDLQWGWEDWGYESFVTISNVEIITASVNPVPEPATFFLIAVGLAGLAGFRKRVKSFLG